MHVCLHTYMHACMYTYVHASLSFSFSFAFSDYFPPCLILFSSPSMRLRTLFVACCIFLSFSCFHSRSFLPYIHRFLSPSISQGDGADSKPGARGQPFSGSPPNYLNDDARPLHHTPQDKGTWWGDNDAWYDGWEQHRTDLWPPYQSRYTDESTDGKMLNGGGWKAMADDLNRGGNDYPEYKRTGMAPEFWERPGDEHDLDNPGKVSRVDAGLYGENFLDAGKGGEITGGTSFADDWKKARPIDKLPPWCDRILGCPPPYNDIGEQDLGRSSDGKTTWSWPYNENGKKIQLGSHRRAFLKESRSLHVKNTGDRHRAPSQQEMQAALMEAQAEQVESQGTSSAADDTASAKDVAIANAAMSASGKDSVAEMAKQSLQGVAAVDDAAWGVETVGADDKEEGRHREAGDGGNALKDDLTGSEERAYQHEESAADSASDSDLRELVRGHPSRRGSQRLASSADNISNFRVRNSILSPQKMSPRTLSESGGSLSHRLSRELDHYLSSFSHDSV